MKKKYSEGWISCCGSHPWVVKCTKRKRQTPFNCIRVYRCLFHFDCRTLVSVQHDLTYFSIHLLNILGVSVLSCFISTTFSLITLSFCVTFWVELGWKSESRCKVNGRALQNYVSELNRHLEKPLNWNTF